ncbi:beta family protein [Thermodesulfobacteriota bacterium]
MTYYPFMKTRDAELRAYSKLSDQVKNLIIPIFELTKSRRTSIVPDGDIHRRMNYLEEIVGKRPFILDVTTVDKYSNPQTKDLLDETNGFYEWQYFLNKYDQLNIIPTIHIYNDEEYGEVEKFIRWASVKFDKLALRVPSYIDEISPILDMIVENIDDRCSLLLLIDAEFIPISEQDNAIEEIGRVIEEASQIIEQNNIVIITSTFPKIVAELGEDHKGSFKIRELQIYNALSDEYSVQYGDYASIHPLQYEMRGGTWVPRIDVSLAEDFIYTRYRRKDGGYIKAAEKMLNNREYVRFNCWGYEEIEKAAQGDPGGKSPAYWISVRMNFHMSRRAKEFRNA